MTHVPDPFLSDAANAKWAAIEARRASGGPGVLWSDLLGLAEPNPNLPDCQSWDGSDGPKCERENHHDGPHRAVVQW